MMKRTKATIAAAIAVGVLAVGGGIAVASRSGEDSEAPIAKSDLERASKAALEHTKGGRVTDTEVGDEESKYEVEVTMDDGTEIDVQLDEAFNVVGSETEDAGEEEDEGADGGADETS